ncbi:hypothetical protein PoB_004943700 [Plakobranchus ocellatus]|uniref:PH domain-containing protein n=1 Tax=Plakobranchus ocellatus TaxID=259542 RepID=A0AAV4BUB7_9GAST|nr:hypothetical protein PoB_004943700 [Plakobranchus ocellatus]
MLIVRQKVKNVREYLEEKTRSNNNLTSPGTLTHFGNRISKQLRVPYSKSIIINNNNTNNNNNDDDDDNNNNNNNNNIKNNSNNNNNNKIELYMSVSDGSEPQVAYWMVGLRAA